MLQLKVVFCLGTSEFQPDIRHLISDNQNDEAVSYWTSLTMCFDTLHIQVWNTKVHINIRSKIKVKGRVRVRRSSGRRELYTSLVLLQLELCFFYYFSFLISISIETDYVKLPKLLYESVL